MVGTNDGNSVYTIMRKAEESCVLVASRFLSKLPSALPIDHCSIEADG